MARRRRRYGRQTARNPFGFCKSEWLRDQLLPLSPEQRLRFFLGFLRAMRRLQEKETA
jgi:hypothetical protein